MQGNLIPYLPHAKRALYHLIYAPYYYKGIHSRMIIVTMWDISKYRNILGAEKRLTHSSFFSIHFGSIRFKVYEFIISIPAKHIFHVFFSLNFTLPLAIKFSHSRLISCSHFTILDFIQRCNTMVLWLCQKISSINWIGLTLFADTLVNHVTYFTLERLILIWAIALMSTLTGVSTRTSKPSSNLPKSDILTIANNVRLFENFTLRKPTLIKMD